MLTPQLQQLQHEVLKLETLQILCTQETLQ